MSVQTRDSGSDEDPSFVVDSKRTEQFEDDKLSQDTARYQRKEEVS